MLATLFAIVATLTLVGVVQAAIVYQTSKKRYALGEKSRLKHAYVGEAMANIVVAWVLFGVLAAALALGAIAVFRPSLVGAAPTGPAQAQSPWLSR